MNLGDLIKSLVSRFSDDPTAASVVLSWLEDRQRWYASAVRYTERYGAGKHVVAKATGESIEEALGSLASELRWWLQPCVVKFVFHVVEEYDDAAPEDFGGYLAYEFPAPGDVVQLKWLDGRDAYRVRVKRVLVDDFVLRVEKFEDAVTQPPSVPQASTEKQKDAALTWDELVAEYGAANPGAPACTLLMEQVYDLAVEQKDRFQVMPDGTLTRRLKGALEVPAVAASDQR